MGCREVLYKLQCWFRSEGIATKLEESYLLVDYKYKGSSVPLVIEVDEETGYARVSIPTNYIVENSSQAYRLLEENFLKWGVKYAVDTEGYIVLLIELPLECINAVGIRVFRERVIDFLAACYTMIVESK